MADSLETDAERYTIVGFSGACYTALEVARRLLEPQPRTVQLIAIDPPTLASLREESLHSWVFIPFGEIPLDRFSGLGRDLIELEEARRHL